MKRLILSGLILISIATRAQISDALTKDTIDLWVVTNGTKSITAVQINNLLTKLNTNKLHKDSVSNVVRWSLSGSDITNTNAGTVIVDSLLKIWPMPPGVLAAHDNPYKFMVMGNDGRVWWANALTASQIIDDTVSDAATAGSPPVTATWVRDTTDGILSPSTATDWALLDNTTETMMSQPDFELTHWKADLLNAYVTRSDNAKIVFIGDSYTPHYARIVLKEGGNRFGYGGGFNTFEDEVAYSEFEQLYNAVSGWTAGQDNNDSLFWAGRYISNDNTLAASTIWLSQKYFTECHILYRQISGGGSFSVQLGSLGTPDTISTDGVVGAKWYLMDMGRTCGMTDISGIANDTVMIKPVSGTVRLYGYYLGNDPVAGVLATPVKPVEVHQVWSGGTNFDHWVNNNKRAAELQDLCDTLDASLYCIIQLETAVQANYADVDSLVDMIRTYSPGSDVMIIVPHDEDQHYSSTYRDMLYEVALNDSCAFFDSYKYDGSYADLSDAGFITDGTHLGVTGEYLAYWGLAQYLFPQAAYSDDVTGKRFTSYGKGIRFPISTTIAFNTRGLLNSYTGSYNNFHGWDSGSKTTTGSYNNIFGGLAGENLTTGTYNDIFGYNAGNDLTTGATNVLIGANAGEKITTVNSNTIVGANAGKAVTTAGNTFIGGQAGIVQTSGTGNTFVGYNAGNNQTTGSDNVIVGYNAGDNSTEGSNNVFIGKDAGRCSSAYTSGDIVAIGYRAGYAKTSGVKNIMIGTETLYNNAAGTSNVAIGYRTGYGTTGTGNTLTGYMAGYGGLTNYNTVYGYQGGYTGGGASNTFLGYKAGYAVTGSSNVMIGNEAGSAAVAVSNLLYIDNSNTSAPLIQGDFSANTLVVNGTRYDVIGTIADNDSTPSFAGGNLWKYNGTANSVSIDAIDDEVVGAEYTIIGNSGTYTITVIDGTPAGGDSFNLSGSNWVGGQSDVLKLRCIATGSFIEVSRSDN